MPSESNGKLGCCYFCPTGEIRSDNLKKHCATKHKSPAPIIAMGRTPCNHVFHMLEGFSDRVYAVRGESQTSVGHCFSCNRFVQCVKGLTIEATMSGHVCPTFRERAKRGGSSVSSSSTKSTVGVIVTADMIRDWHKESKGAIHFEADDEGEIDVAASLEGIVEDAATYYKSHKRVAALETEMEKMKTDSPSVTVAEGGSVGLSEARMVSIAEGCRGVRTIVRAVKQRVETSRDPDSEPGEDYFFGIIGALNTAVQDCEAAKKEELSLSAENTALRQQYSDLQHEHQVIKTNCIALHKENADLNNQLQKALAELAALKAATK